MRENFARACFYFLPDQFYLHLKATRKTLIPLLHNVVKWSDTLKILQQMLKDF